MKMSTFKLTYLFAFLLTAALLVAPVIAGAEQIQTHLNGYEEVPSISTFATGDFRGKISPQDDAIDWEMSYSSLQGDVTQAHIHFGQSGANGGVMVWLCGTEGFEGPAGTPTCPQEGTVSGTITAEDVVGPAGQLVEPGDLEAAIAAIRAGSAYVNVHSTAAPGGEIRGQIRASRRGGLGRARGQGQGPPN